MYFGVDPIWKSRLHFFHFSQVSTTTTKTFADLSPRHLGKQSHRSYLRVLNIGIIPGFGGLDFSGQICNPGSWHLRNRTLTAAPLSWSWGLIHATHQPEWSTLSVGDSLQFCRGLGIQKWPNQICFLKLKQNKSIKTLNQKKSVIWPPQIRQFLFF